MASAGNTGRPSGWRYLVSLRVMLRLLSRAKNACACSVFSHSASNVSSAMLLSPKIPFGSTYQNGAI
ncbi:hypothetical protein C1J03_08000 [Sulfitobacter sp. SK012]|nr:hypothetical protein C1J03_08000 [Sulfitobacter sp. SK012]